MLTPEQKQQLRDALMSKYNQAQDNSGVEAAQADAGKTDLISGIGEALSTAASANAVSRGGAAPKLDFYQNMRTSARDAIKQAMEARQGKIAGVKGEMDIQNAFADDDRADEGLTFNKAQAEAANKRREEDLLRQKGRDEAEDKFRAASLANGAAERSDRADERALTREQKAAKDKADQEAKQAEIDRKNAEHLESMTVPGHGIGRNPKEAEEFRGEVADTQNAIQILEQVKALGKGVTVWDREKVNTIDTLLKNAIGKMRLSLVGPGPMTDSERATVRSSIGDPTTLFSTESIQNSKLDTTINTLKKTIANKAKQVIKTPETDTPPPPDAAEARRKRIAELKAKAGQ